MFINVEVNYYKTKRVASVDASTLRVEVERLQSDPSIICYNLVGTTDQGRLLIRSSYDAGEMLDLYDHYMDLDCEKGDRFAEVLGGVTVAG